MSGTGTLAALEDFLALLRDELGLAAGVEDAGRDLRDLPDWDSLYLLRLVALLEEETGRRVPVRKVLEARSLREIHTLAKEQE
ncbi:hypothetical protein VR41_06075 [Streptomyces sp. NRRL B-1568]|uniref:Acyl carrier protein n=1 Tax=Streptomyces olivoverticillatus TaxID=66427 RepID=A0A7W7PKE3_9ACTN|nr:phosphopantetheine-binding protein [Streptomyces olivoverticillatus]KJY42845.1 hypothetical protein VR41_06075 [Streptomyces sp. NRRL B-1568]MBB4892308.1 acyl carrier protein [Streptomyces olivoverticillatus]